MVFERFGVRQSGLITEELQLPRVVRRRKVLQKQSAEQPREDADRKEESGSARDPTLSVRRDAAAWHDHVDVRMVTPTPTIP